MRTIGLLIPATLVCALASGARGQASSTADVVHLRTDCTGVSDCFTTTSAVTNWLWGSGGGARSAPPSANDRVSVLVGPGTFDKFVCDATTTPRGWVSVIGSGRSQTRIQANSGSADQELQFSNGIFCHGAVTVYGCSELDFQNLTAYGSDSGVLWIEGGSATWSDVDMVAGGTARTPGCAYLTATYGWNDNGNGTKSVHNMFGSRMIGLGTNGSYNAGMFSRYAEIWLWGGDVLAEPDFAGTTITAQYAVEIQNTAEFRAFGTSIRNLVGASTQSWGFPFEAVIARNNSKFHLHGGIINADCSSAAGDCNATAVNAIGNSFIHALDTAFAVKAAGNGVATRLKAGINAKIEAPFLWDQRATPPAVVSLNGADLFVDTAAGAGNDEAHLMVYDTSCTGAGGPWRDMVGGACRN